MYEHFLILLQCQIFKQSEITLPVLREMNLEVFTPAGRAGWVIKHSWV